jgi:hypothetical protein
LAVLVGSGEEKNVKPVHALKPGQGVGSHGGVSVADMGDIIHVVNGRGDVKSGFRGHKFSSSSSGYRATGYTGLGLKNHYKKVISRAEIKGVFEF